MQLHLQANLFWLVEFASAKLQKSSCFISGASGHSYLELVLERAFFFAVESLIELSEETELI